MIVAKNVLAFVLLSTCQLSQCLAVETHSAAAASTTVKSSAAYLTALNSITAETLKEHVCCLADDALQGRKPGTPGGRAAGEYVAAAFRKYALSPGDVPLGEETDTGEAEAGADADASGDYFQPFEAKYRNVLALLPGSDAELKKEVIVVGAHYDHIGSGNDVYNGADDNASGASALLELAEACSLLPQPPRRTIIFAAWDGEESGLLGSGYWQRHCRTGDRRVVFAFNMDMIGRLRNEKLAVHACRSGYGLRRLVSTLNSGLALEFPGPVKRCSDHWTFFDVGIPVMMFNTGRHEELHTPDDDAAQINDDGMRRVARLAFETVIALADAEEVTKFRDASRNETDEAAVCDAGRFAAVIGRFGATWINAGGENGGIRLDAVYPHKAAERAAFEPGDCVVSFAGRTIDGGDDMQSAVLTAASPAEITVRRDGRAEPLSLSVDLDGKPLRLGIFWREDDAEPGTTVLTYIVPQTPAARAGLQSGDRIYAVNGKAFADDEEFVKLIENRKGPLQLQVERDGKLRTVEIWPDDAAFKQAA